MNRTVLITGFEPFGGSRVNPSAQLATRLDGSRIWGRGLVAEILPVVFGDSVRQLQRHLHRHQPELVICLGLAGGRQKLSLERVAVNLDDARIPDNAGQQPVDEPVRRRGAAAYFSTLPIKAMHRAVDRGGWPVEISNTAGTYVCNHVFYGLLHSLRRRPGVRGGFVHVPAPHRGFSLDEMEAALRTAVTTALRRRNDLRVSAGRED